MPPHLPSQNSHTLYTVSGPALCAARGPSQPRCCVHACLSSPHTGPACRGLQLVDTLDLHYRPRPRALTAHLHCFTHTGHHRAPFYQLLDELKAEAEDDMAKVRKDTGIRVVTMRVACWMQRANSCLTSSKLKQRMI